LLLLLVKPNQDRGTYTSLWRAGNHWDRQKDQKRTEAIPRATETHYFRQPAQKRTCEECSIFGKICYYYI